MTLTIPIKTMAYAFTLMIAVVYSLPLYAHHILGRPSYNLDEDSTTPPAIEIESRLDNFQVSAMVYPAVPDPHEHGRINLHIMDTDSGSAFRGEVTFLVRYDSFFLSGSTLLGTQSIDDNVYRQGFVFEKADNYIISAEFHNNGKSYSFDMPLRVGNPVVASGLPLVITVLALSLFTFSIYKRRQIQRLRVKQHSYRNHNQDNNHEQA